VENIRADLCISFDTTMAEHPRFFYNEIAFLLALAFADEALVGVGSLSELWNLDFPPNTDKIPLLWTEAAMRQPILRTVTRVGVTDEPMSRAAFSRIFSATVKNAGYSCSVTVHAIRRYLGHEVDSEFPSPDETPLTHRSREIHRGAAVSTFDSGRHSYLR
jgi:hypothetical protein